MEVDYKMQAYGLAPALNRDLGFQLPMLVDIADTQESTPRYHKSRTGDAYASAVNFPSSGYIASSQRTEPRKTIGAKDPLSKREREILQLAAEGNSNKEIAHKCCVSEATVKTHFRNIFSKIDVNSRTAAVVYATAAGVLDMNQIAVTYSRDK
ncbi:MAG: helix-turn-helix transcriptional regulator [Dehalococcoidales bacterium]|nr:helix-turn-helix transcriptional regulator [Dehalococcoidales bacterium]